MNLLKNLTTKKTIFLLTTIFLIARLVLLTKLPIFNDEAIYLDWGFRELHTPGALFYSLIDGKQPLLMWIFGTSQTFFSDPLFAGRFIAVLGGLATLLGLYVIGIKYFSKTVGVTASLLYISVPIFVAYDRLALMESAISACSVWSLFFLLRLLESPKQRYAFFLGIILGIGFFIKSNMLIFILSVIIILLVRIIKQKGERTSISLSTITASVTFLLITLPLFLQPAYWQTITMNSRYSLTFSELIKFPLVHFVSNFLENGMIMLVFLTPFVTILGLLKIIKSLKEKNMHVLISIFVIFNLFLQTLLVRSTTQRYLVSFLPLILLFAASELKTLKKKTGRLYPLIVTGTFLIPILLTTVQMVNPLGYVKLTSPSTKQTDSGFILGQISGYGIETINSRIKEYSKGGPLVLLTAINIGNPESAVRTYFNKSANIKVGYLDKKMFGVNLDGVNCLNPQVPTLYVSRDEQQSEMNDYLEEVSRVNHPYSEYSLGLYKFKANCSGKSIPINPYILTQ